MQTPCIETTLLMPREGAAHDLLTGLLRDHRSSAACVELLIQQLTEPRSAHADITLISSLIDQIIDSPDDFHHMTERRLYRRLWYRIGHFLPQYLDLDELHEERRKLRLEVIGVRGKRDDVFIEKNRARHALLALCNCVRLQIEIEENKLYPLLRRYLSPEDWEIIEGETEAYAVLSASLQCRIRHAH